MSSPFTRRATALGTLFRFYPGAIYEYQNRVWRVVSVSGHTPVQVVRSDAFERLQTILRDKGVEARHVVVPTNGRAEIWPQTWVCSNSQCRRFESGEMDTLNCPSCGTEMNQSPFVVLCDSCGYLDAPHHGTCRQHYGAYVRREWPNREDLYTLRLVCSECGERVYSDFHRGATCPFCRNDGDKRISPATASYVTNPLHTKTFDEDTQTMIDRALTSASREMQTRNGYENIFTKMQRVFAIEDIYLTEISVLLCTYGYRVGRSQQTKTFPNNTIYIKAYDATAALFKFKADRLGSNRRPLLHAAAHALLQPAGYITGLGPDKYLEYVDEENAAVMVFTTESGGSGVLIREPIKLVQWLRRARSLVHGCKNQCRDGCPWCLYISNWQCSEFNENMNRISLAELWSERFLIGDLNGIG